MAKNETSGSTNGAILMDERLALTPEQAFSLRTLYQAKKERVEALQDIDGRIQLAYQMLGIENREMTAGDLGDEDPYLMPKALPAK